MNCPKCGKLLSDDAAFCTECGQNLQQVQNNPILQNDHAANPTTAENDGAFNFILKLNRFIEHHGAAFLNKYLSLAVIVAVVMISLFGYLVCAFLIGLFNGYLIYLDYKRTCKINTKMCIWSLAALLIWLLTYIQI